MSNKKSKFCVRIMSLREKCKSDYAKCSEKFNNNLGRIYKCLDLFRGIAIFVVSITACIVSVIIMIKLVRIWPDNISSDNLFMVLTQCLVALITVGGFAITLFVLISDRRKRKINRLAAQVCAYHVEENIMLERIKFLETIIDDNNLAVDLGTEVATEAAKKEHFRDMAFTDKSNYLGARPGLSALDACKVVYSI